MKKTKKTRNYNVGYEQYSRQFSELKKSNNLKRDVRKFSKKTYNELRSMGYSTKEILKEQMFLDKKKQRRAWKNYKKIREQLNPGEAATYDNSYWGENNEEIEGIGYHRTLSGLLRDKNAFHFLITNDILTSGKSREEVLAQYGYED